MLQTLTDIARAFGLPGTIKTYCELTSGHVHHTYKLDMIEDDGTEKSYVAQKMNTFAFRQPIALMNNIAKVTDYLREKNPNRINLRFFQTVDAHTPYLEDGDSFWRVFNFIPSRTYNLCKDLEIIYGAGTAFGEFQSQLKDFPADELVETIPNFHNTCSRYDDLVASAQRDSKKRFHEVEEEYNWYISVREKACTLTKLLEQGELPLRVTHNDTKINNVLFDQNSKNPLVVIDLDTVMPGIAAHDFGDAIRFAANTVEEEHVPATDAKLDMDIYRAFAEGYLRDTASSLTKKEIETLALGAFVMTVECGARFLMDYLDGDVYFKTDYEKHNLDRARCQMELAKDMLRKEEQMNEVVLRVAAENTEGTSAQ